MNKNFYFKVELLMSAFANITIFKTPPISTQPSMIKDKNMIIFMSLAILQLLACTVQ